MLFFWAPIKLLFTFEFFRAHRGANRNLKIALGIFISKWIIASRVTELSISLQKYAAIETNENIDSNVRGLNG